MTDLGDVRLHDNTSAALRLCDAWTSEMVMRKVDFYTDGSFKNDDASFAVAAIGHGHQAEKWRTVFMGCFGGRVCLQDTDPCYVGATHCSAFEAEISAISWVALWILAHQLSLGEAVIHVHFDANAVGWGAAGKWNLPDAPSATKARQLFQFAEAAVGKHRLQWHHVKGHSGHPFNELVDSVATAFREDSNGPIPRPRPRWAQAPGILELEWANLISEAKSGGSLPLMHDGILNWKLPDCKLTAMTPQEVIPVQGAKRSAVAEVHIKAVTINVQSAIGKYQFLEQQMLEKGANIVFLQESKAKEGLIRSQQYRYASQSDGHWATEVWLARKIPVTRSGGQHHVIDEAEVHIIGKGPRQMSISVRVLGIIIYLSSLHFPSRTRPASEIMEFRDTVDALLQRCQDGYHLVGMDANARVPAKIEGVTGDLDTADADDMGVALAGLMQRRQYWLPNTYETVHSGRLETWRHPCGQRSRIDYFGIANAWGRVHVRTSAWEALELLNANEDHTALFLELRSSFETGTVARPSLVRQGDLDISQLRDPVVANSLEQRLAAAQLHKVDWSKDVNEHAHFLQEQIMQAMEEVLPRKSSRPRATYISNEAWSLRDAKRHCKQKSDDRRGSYKLDVLRLGMQTWRADKATEYEGARAQLHKCTLIYEVNASAIRLATEKIKRRIADDKNRYLCQLVSRQGTRADCLVAAVSDMRLGRKKPKPWRRALPQLVDADNQAVKSRDELDTLWLQHFSALEMGASKFLAQAAEVAEPFRDYEPSRTAMLSLTEIESAFRTCKKKKSVGLDRLPGDVLQAFPALFAGIYQPLFNKAILRVQQPVFWRGGMLAEANKNAGSASSTSSYRALFVSSTVGKAYHRAIRSKIIGPAERTIGDMRYGARRGASVVHGSHALILHERACEANGRSTGYLGYQICLLRHHQTTGVWERRSIGNGRSGAENHGALRTTA